MTAIVTPHVAWLERELTARRSAYPGMIAKHAITQAQADHDLRMLSEIRAAIVDLAPGARRFARRRRLPPAPTLLLEFPDAQRRQDFIDIIKTLDNGPAITVPK